MPVAGTDHVTIPTFLTGGNEYHKEKASRARRQETRAQAIHCVTACIGPCFSDNGNQNRSNRTNSNWKVCYRKETKGRKKEGEREIQKQKEIKCNL